MPRWSQHAEDSFRLPEGFRRVGYDADTMRYTFTDKNGKLYQSAPGEEYGTLTPVTVSASTNRPGAFSDGKNPKVESTGSPSTFQELLPPSAITSASSSSVQNLPAPPPKVHFNGAMRTALPKMRGVVQSLRRSITGKYSKGSTSAAGQASRRRESGKSSSSTTAASSGGASTVDQSKSSESNV
ncbi:uncharacterized protein BT62DRAFT_994870 [Guyanagaster necrorhizus]|uniref:Uncharacterized protein n=1 Tax=Guyanagaster necrorhizus TaxID=856835 RepID=A0A9P7VSZ1_9AGAR|nr:uncharacterized protein BT62DRAFT_994870 [Guyanagaster necrorhizus MCA 3950]KAG7445391.1 hypothetical protein BT62DRAFT_994870 [Guyanagaster necrorhizus MCA 3950]